MKKLAYILRWYTFDSSSVTMVQNPLNAWNLSLLCTVIQTLKMAQPVFVGTQPTDRQFLLWSVTWRRSAAVGSCASSCPDRAERCFLAVQGNIVTAPSYKTDHTQRRQSLINSESNQRKRRYGSHTSLQLLPHLHWSMVAQWLNSSPSVRRVRTPLKPPHRKSFTHSCLYNMIRRPTWLPCG